MNDSFEKKLQDSLQKNLISEKILHILKEFYICYKKVSKKEKFSFEIFSLFLDLIIQQIRSPFHFKHYHQKIQKPFDYYHFGITFLKPLIKLSSSHLLKISNLEKIKKQLKQKENVFLLANHQSESDPQILSILLEKKYPEIGKNIIYIAGERVLKDPLAIPFSMGCDILSIYSKKYINTPPQLKREKQLYNKKTLQIMSSILSNGGKIIYAAPSGGRDRPDANRNIQIAPFDPQSLELLYLMTKKAAKTTHFYPLSLFTYDILPPPDKTQEEMGEKRITKGGKAHAYFGEEIDMENFPMQEDKQTKRQKRAKYIEKKVIQGYEKLKIL